MNERLREALRRKVEKHNRLVRLSTLASGVAVLIMWVGIYFVARWLTLFFATVIQGVDAEMPANFDRTLAKVTLVWMVAGWIARQADLFKRARVEGTPGLVMLEVLLAPPRVTYATLANLRNFVRFSEDDLIAATDFLVRVVRSGKLPVTAVPLELPKERNRDRIINGLTLLDLIYLRRRDQEAWIVISNPERLLAFLN